MTQSTTGSRGHVVVQSYEELFKRFRDALAQTPPGHVAVDYNDGRSIQTLHLGGPLFIMGDLHGAWFSGLTETGTVNIHRKHGGALCISTEQG
jgi:hypothetical protein